VTSGKRGPHGQAEGPTSRAAGGRLETDQGASSEPNRKHACPFCGSEDAEVISLFGSQVMTLQCKCRACGTFFEASKY
jgi:transcription elongation factor Elf1